jgi:hypothetical protein
VKPLEVLAIKRYVITDEVIQYRVEFIYRNRKYVCAFDPRKSNPFMTLVGYDKWDQAGRKTNLSTEALEKIGNAIDKEIDAKYKLRNLL